MCRVPTSHNRRWNQNLQKCKEHLRIYLQRQNQWQLLIESHECNHVLHVFCLGSRLRIRHQMKYKINIRPILKVAQPLETATDSARLSNSLMPYYTYRLTVYLYNIMYHMFTTISDGRMLIVYRIPAVVKVRGRGRLSPSTSVVSLPTSIFSPSKWKFSPLTSCTLIAVKFHCNHSTGEVLSSYCYYRISLFTLWISADSRHIDD